MSSAGSLDIPAAWAHSALVILRRRHRKILVIGAADRGKSSYCSFLAHTLCATAATVAFVDADIGQKDVGPPATLSLAYVEAAKPLVQARLAGLYFIGSVSPVGYFLPIVVGARRLVDAARATFVIVNTTGLVHGGGRLLTSFQIESLQPDCIVALEQHQELDPIVTAYRHLQVLRLRSSPLAAPKSREARRAARERAFRDYFAAARELTLELDRLLWQRCLLFNGRRYADPRFVYAERTSEGVIGIAATPIAAEEGLRPLPAGFERNLLCGVADRHGDGVGLALIQAIDWQRATITLWTPVTVKQIRILQFGELYLDLDGREVRERLDFGL